MQSKPTGLANPWLHLALSVACVTIYELLLKLGARETANLSDRWDWTGISGLALMPFTCMPTKSFAIGPKPASICASLSLLASNALTIL